MKSVTKEIFISMGNNGFIDDSNGNRNFYISGKSKNSRQKNWFVCEDDYDKYVRFINKNIK